jgi:hypothetical protein
MCYFRTSFIVFVFCFRSATAWSMGDIGGTDHHALAAAAAAAAAGVCDSLRDDAISRRESVTFHGDSLRDDAISRRDSVTFHGGVGMLDIKGHLPSSAEAIVSSYGDDAAAATAAAAAGDNDCDETWVDVADSYATPAPLFSAPTASTAAAAASALSATSLFSPSASAALTPAATHSSQSSDVPPSTPTPSSSSPASQFFEQTETLWHGRVTNVAVTGDALGTLVLSRQKIWFTPDDKESPLGFWDNTRCSWYCFFVVCVCSMVLCGMSRVTGMCPVSWKYTADGTLCSLALQLIFAPPPSLLSPLSHSSTILFRYLHQPTASSSVFIEFSSDSSSESKQSSSIQPHSSSQASAASLARSFYNALKSLCTREQLAVCYFNNARDAFAATGIYKKWLAGHVTNFDYIMALNTFSGRSFNDLRQ